MYHGKGESLKAERDDCALTNSRVYFYKLLTSLGTALIPSNLPGHHCSTVRLSGSDRVSGGQFHQLDSRHMCLLLLQHVQSEGEHLFSSLLYDLDRKSHPHRNAFFLFIFSLISNAVIPS